MYFSIIIKIISKASLLLFIFSLVSCDEFYDFFEEIEEVALVAFVEFCKNPDKLATCDKVKKKCGTTEIIDGNKCEDFYNQCDRSVADFCERVNRVNDLKKADKQ